jgi:hypothetical protein
MRCGNRYSEFDFYLLNFLTILRFFGSKTNLIKCVFIFLECKQARKQKHTKHTPTKKKKLILNHN